MDKICDIVCPSHQEFKNHIMNHKSNQSKVICCKKHNKLELNLKRLLVSGSSTSKIYARTIMASSFTLAQCKDLTEDPTYEETHSNEYNDLKFGRRCFQKYKQLFEELMTGNDIPSNAYKYRVPVNKITMAISFLQETLQMKSGITRNMSLDGFSFNHLPVYQRGGIPVDSLFKFYKLGHGIEEQLGKSSFVETLKLITQRGEAKAGLSIYYIHFRHCNTIFNDMMKHVAVVLKDHQEGIEVQKDVNKLLDQ